MISVPNAWFPFLMLDFRGPHYAWSASARRLADENETNSQQVNQSGSSSYLSPIRRQLICQPTPKAAPFEIIQTPSGLSLLGSAKYPPPSHSLAISNTSLVASVYCMRCGPPLIFHHHAWLSVTPLHTWEVIDARGRDIDYGGAVSTRCMRVETVHNSDLSHLP